MISGDVFPGDIIRWPLAVKKDRKTKSNPNPKTYIKYLYAHVLYWHKTKYYLGDSIVVLTSNSHNQETKIQVLNIQDVRKNWSYVVHAS